MELMQLEMFVAVVEQQSINKAADKVRRTQPALSIALRKLEDEIGSTLIHRSKRFDYQLTPAGELLYSYATRLLALRNEAVAALIDFRELRRGRLRIGANESTSLYLLPRLTQVFHEQYPEIKIEVTCDHSEQLLADLHDRRLDLALLAHLPQRDGLDVRLVMKDELVLIADPQHRLAAFDKIHVRDLASEAIITEGAESSLHEKVVNAFHLYQTTLNVPVESANIETIKRMVAAGVGVAFVPLMCVQEEVAEGRLVIIPVGGFQHKRSLWAVRRGSDADCHPAHAFMTVVSSLSRQLKLVETVDEIESAGQDQTSEPLVDFKSRKQA